MDLAAPTRIHEVPAPAAMEPGWYADPLGSTAERYWDRTWLELTRVPTVRPPRPLVPPSQNGHEPKKGLRFPLSFVGLKSPPSEEEEPKAGGKKERKQRKEREERKREFFASPAGQARLAYGQSHDVFQCHLPLTRPELVVIPSVQDAAPVITSDPVQILNSVIAEGWKLEAGSFFWADAGGGVVGYYLFK